MSKQSKKEYDRNRYLKKRREIIIQTTNWRKSNPDKYRTMQKNHRKSENFKRWQQKNREHLRNYQRMKKYGVDKDKYYEMLENQKGCCQICGIHHTKLKRNLAVDHCHTTGRVRGLLCGNCNTAIGLLKESEELIGKVLKYIKQ